MKFILRYFCSYDDRSIVRSIEHFLPSAACCCTLLYQDRTIHVPILILELYSRSYSILTALLTCLSAVFVTHRTACYAMPFCLPWMLPRLLDGAGSVPAALFRGGGSRGDCYLCPAYLAERRVSISSRAIESII